MTTAQKLAILAAFVFTWINVGILYARMSRAESIVRGLIGGWRRGR